ncbi:MAG: hydroxymethylglutaryl-CoA lyase [Alphaproteobacteria bacterium]
MLPEKVKIYEVGPRDGLQNEKTPVPSAIKIELINRLSDTGLQYIEATSFVSPKAIPQLGDAAEIMRGIERKEGVIYPVLIPNMRGMDNALQSDIQEIALFTAASESFTSKNINASIDESFERFAPVIESAKAHNIKIRGYVSCVLGCPYEGEIAPAKVAETSKRLLDAGCYEISLGDTIGVGTPEKTKHLIRTVLDAGVPLEKIALHMHDTYGQALANIYAGLQEGVNVIDSSVAGLGGCPYAKGASGNVATEDVLYMLRGMGVETGIDLGKIIETAWFISGALKRKPASKVAHALKPAA